MNEPCEWGMFCYRCIPAQRAREEERQQWRREARETDRDPEVRAERRARRGMSRDAMRWRP